jgi:hypothetical protein
MGGLGSGNFRGAKRCVEECITLTSSWMLQNNYLNLELGAKRYNWTITWPDAHYRRRYVLTFDLERVSLNEMRLTLRDTEQVIYLLATPMRFGGLRWWFKCTGCFHNCANLYLDRVSEKFYCRMCLDLTYRVCQASHTFDSVYAEIASRNGVTTEEVRRMFARTKRAHRRPWIRTRDRHGNYKRRREFTDVFWLLLL